VSEEFNLYQTPSLKNGSCIQLSTTASHFHVAFITFHDISNKVLHDWPRLYNTVLRACEGQPSVVLALYSRLQLLGLADHVTYSTAINACGWQVAMLLLQQMHGCLNCWRQSFFEEGMGDLHHQN